MTGAVVVCGLGPVYLDWAIRDMRWPVGLGFRLAQKRKRLLKWLVGGVLSPIMKARPELIRPIILAKCAFADRAVLQRREISIALLEATREALRQGSAGVLHDFNLYAHPWDLNFDAIMTPVVLWHGQADATVPVSHTEYLAGVLPKARARVLPEEGHFSLPVNHMTEILALLLAS